MELKKTNCFFKKINWPYLVFAFIILISLFCYYYSMVFENFEFKYTLQPNWKGVDILNSYHEKVFLNNPQVHGLLEFTFLSNVLVFIYFFLRSFNLLDPYRKIWAKLFQVNVVVATIVTFIIYWATISWVEIIWTNIWRDSSYGYGSTVVHNIIPWVTLGTFCFETKKQKKINLIKMKYYHIWFVILFPLLWFLMAIIIYYSTRSLRYYEIYSKPYVNLPAEYIGSNIKYGDFFYYFLAFDLLKPELNVLIILSITLLVFLLSFSFIDISRTNSWQLKLIKKFRSKKTL